MSRIGSWDKIVDRKVKDVKQSGIMYVPVRKWKNRETGETVTIAYVFDDTHRTEFYQVEYNGEAVGADNSLSAAYDSAIDTLKHYPHGGL